MPHGENLQSDAAENALTIHGGDCHSIMKIVQAPRGSLEFELLEPRTGWKHSHNFGGRGAFPNWQSKQPVPSNTVVAIYVDGTRGRLPVSPKIKLSGSRGLMQVKFEGKTYNIRVPY